MLIEIEISGTAPLIMNKFTDEAAPRDCGQGRESNRSWRFQTGVQRPLWAFRRDELG